ncbi:hypothetical protein LWC34_00090 [Kibdelosporangium philippinense]|uniref:Uncharacterized protein n=1 Tax=Kibdelosporangium philippinense TaxID=211113 RepID=A0ABS8Z199_9PSEU|nr:hypothetical protein [Kibdelosporangium philippinense]MCE7001247.1 hypothetical protein [Kibdelosporangium philippinense]
MTRGLVVGALMMAAFVVTAEPVIAVFATIPVLLWCLRLARSARIGLIIGLVLLALAA